MKTTGKGFTAVMVFSALLLATFAVAATTTRYIHVRVSSPGTHELVRVNLPLTLAAQVIPAINHGKLRDGKVIHDEPNVPITSAEHLKHLEVEA